MHLQPIPLIAALAGTISLASACTSNPNTPEPNGDTGGNHPGDDAIAPNGDTYAGDTYSVTPGDGASGPIAAVDFCDHLVEMLCEGEQACCSAILRKYDSVGECITGQTDSCDPDLFTDPRVGYDGGLAGGVVDDYQGYIATCDPAVTAWLASDAGLLRMLTGTLDTGGDCSPNGSTDVAAGASCRPPNACRIHMELLTPVGECGPRAALDGACYTDLECIDELRCDPQAAWLTGGGTCKELLTTGLACGRNGDCASFNCTGDLCAAATADSAYCLD